MKVLIINQFFYPDIAATAQLITDLTEDLISRKSKITVLTSRSNYLGGPLDLKNNGTLIDANVIRVRSSSFGRRSNVGRLIDYVSFYLLVTIRGLFLPRQDVVLVLTTPPLISATALILKLIRGSKYVCLVEDLYPDTAVALGMLREGGVPVRLINWISKTVYRQAESIIAISATMKSRLVARGLSNDKIHVVENWADKNQIYPIPREDNWFVKQHQLEGRFTVEYSGNMGLGHEFGTILTAMRRLRDRDDIRFLFIGDGIQKQRILDFEYAHNLTNVIHLPYQDRRRLPYSISAGDVALISMKRSLDGCIVPCKIYGILAAARPVVFVGGPNSDIAEIVRAANCGFQLEEGDVDGLIRTVNQLREDPELVSSLGHNGYQFFLKNFERRQATAKYFDLLSNVTSEKKRNDLKPQAFNVD